MKPALKNFSSKKAILLVDDDANFRFSVATELRAEGYLVQGAEDGERAIRMVQGNNNFDNDIHLVITDLVMPRKDGLRFCRELRNANDSIPVLVISGHFSREIREDLSAIGCRDHLEKPFTTDELNRKVEKLLTVSHLTLGISISGRNEIHSETKAGNPMTGPEKKRREIP
jgi:DNA-binding response OmpR family regulator